MQRGMISLTPNEINYAWQSMQNSEQDVQNLESRLGAAVQSAQQVANPEEELEVLISEDEAEVLLDSLPMPDPSSEPVEVKNLRGKLSKFLAKFRFGEE